MTAIAIEALRRDSQYLRSVLGTLTAEEWDAASGCEGWTVRDVVAHMASALGEFVDLSSGQATGIDPTEHTEVRMERLVEDLRGRTDEEVLELYDARVAAVLAALEQVATADGPVSFGQLGTYPLHLAADGFAFDHFLHLREDLLRPRGPLDRPGPTTDSLAVHAVLNWELAALPNLNRETLATVRGVVDLLLEPPGERRVHVVMSDGGVEVRDGRAASADAEVRCSGADFVVWATQRRNWRALDVTVAGDSTLAESFCDRLRVY